MAVKKLSIKANMLWNSIGSMTYLGCQWLVTIFVVRLSSGYDAAGLLSLAMAVVGIFPAPSPTIKWGRIRSPTSSTSTR